MKNFTFRASYRNVFVAFIIALFTFVFSSTLCLAHVKHVVVERVGHAYFAIIYKGHVYTRDYHHSIYQKRRKLTK